MKEKIDETSLSDLRNELEDARRFNRPFIASAARHSMGGHSIARAGTTLTAQNSWVEIDTEQQSYRCGAGTLWGDVISALDVNGYSPMVMQSGNAFSVGGSYSVNAHGMSAPFSTFGQTVNALQLMRASGDVITCSPEENADLFTAAMGGYGLFGIVTELELKMTPNTRLAPTFTPVNPLGLGQELARVVNDASGVQMAYATMDISRDRFLENALLVSYRPTSDQDALPPAPAESQMSSNHIRLYHAQLGSDRMKHHRWSYETRIRPWLDRGDVTRNQLLNTPIAPLANRTPERTDILHEYFIEPDRFAAFITACREVILSSYQEALDITIRYVRADEDSWLSYAPSDRISAMILFNQEKSVRAEEDMARMTRRMIDRVLALGGSYYLPYRPHARQDQIEKAYPGLRAFTAKKRAMDPDNLFRNALWDRYMARV